MQPRAAAASAGAVARPDRPVGARLWKNFVFGGYLMPLADAAGMGALGLVAFGTFRWDAALSVFLLTFFVYALNRVVELDTDAATNPERTRLLRSQRRVQTALVCLSFVLAAAVQFAAESWQAGLCAGLWTGTGLWYCFGLKGLTRRVLGLKAFVIAAMYGLWPLHVLWFHSPTLGPGAAEIIAFVVIRMFVSTSISDLKDVEADRAQGLRTFALVLPRRRFLAIMQALNLLSAVPIVIGLLGKSLPLPAAGLLLAVPFGMSFAWAGSANSRTARLFTAVVVDSEGFVWSAGILLFGAL